MITRLRVDGFRSLSRFDMVVNPGLNILVGPNGSGKTNIVSFLQFLSYLPRISCPKRLQKQVEPAQFSKKLAADYTAKLYVPQLKDHIPTFKTRDTAGCPSIIGRAETT